MLLTKTLIQYVAENDVRFASNSRASMHSHAGAWEREKNLIQFVAENDVRFVSNGRASMHSHAGVWEREKTGVYIQ